MLHCQKDLFRLPENVSYLNCAYMAPLLKDVEALGKESLSRKCLPHQITVPDFFQPVEELKAVFARLINAKEKDRIAIIPSVSYGMATVAKNIRLETGHNIVLVEEQFPSNYYSWKRLAVESGAKIKVIRAPQTGGRFFNWNQAILEGIDENTALVAIANVHWADGTLFDLAAVRARCTDCGTLLVVDGTQSVGALPFDVDRLQPDALICAGYKWLLGPYSMGLAYYGPAFDNGTPIEENWINRLNSEDFQNLVNYQALYKPMANRYCVGEQSNFILIPMQKKALEQILEWGIENIQRYCRDLSEDFLGELQDIGCHVENPSHRCGHLFGIRPGKTIDREKLVKQFSDNNIFVSFRGNAIRVAPHLYNDKEDFQRFLRCFQRSRKKVLQ